MLKVGITGGIGSGKTTVAKMLAAKGIPVYYADQKAKYLMSFDPELKADIKKHFGEAVYHSNGRLNRAALAKIIFSDKTKLAIINGLVHPAVARDGEAWFAQQKTTYALKEAALMIESGSHKQLDKLIVVVADEEERINRVVKRDRSDRKAVMARVKNQLSDEERLKEADYVIDNNDFDQLPVQVDALHDQLLSLSK